MSAAVAHVFPVLGRHHSARAALAIMCVTAMDREHPPRWFGGHAALALALGHGAETATTRGRGHRSVARDILLLHELGYLVRDPMPPSGRGRARGATYMVVVRPEDEEPVRDHLREVEDSEGFIAFGNALELRAELLARQ